MLGRRAGADHHVLHVSVVLRGRHQQGVVALGDVAEAGRAFGRGRVGVERRARVVVLQHHCCTGHVGVLALCVAIDGEFILDAHQQAAFLLAHHLQAVADELSVAILAVHRDGARLHDVDVEPRGIEGQHDGGAVAVGQRGQLFRRGQRRELLAAGHAHADPARTARSPVGQHHGDGRRPAARDVGPDDGLVEGQLGLVPARVGVDHKGQRGSLVAGQAEPHALPVVGSGRLGRQHGQLHVSLAVGFQHADVLGGRLVVACVCGGHGLDVVQGQAAQVPDGHAHRVGLTGVHIALDKGRRRPGHAIDVDGGHRLSGVLTGDAGAHRKVAARACWQHEVGREVAVGVGRGLQGVALAVAHHVGLHTYLPGTAAQRRQLAADRHGLAHLVVRAVGRHGVAVG